MKAFRGAEPGALEGRAPRVAIVRGPNLNKWEMQNYEALSGPFDLTAYTTTAPTFDLGGIRFPVVRVPSHPEHPAYMVGLEQALSDADLIYSADTTWMFSFQAVRFRKKRGNRLVCLQWENIPFAYEESGEMKELKAAVREGADHFVAVTERAKEALVLEGVEPGRITVIPMGIDTEWFRPDASLRKASRERLGISREAKLVLFTGRMVWEKGVYDFVHAAALAASSLGNVPVRYVMVGKGPERDPVVERARELGLSSSMRFIESHPYDRMRDLFNAADLFVLPSITTRTWKEQFGMVLVEAMACGTPVLSTSSGSIPEVVGDAGILVPANDPGDLSRAISMLCRDEALRAQLAERGRARAVAVFDSKTVAEQVGKVFSDVLASAGRSSGATAVRSSGPVAPPAPSAGDAYYRQERGEVLALVPPGASRILDVGCGEGILGKRLLEKGASEVVGIEVDPAVAGRARGNLSRVLEGDIESLGLPFEEGHFDAIILADVLEHLRDPLTVLTNLKRYLADTGTIVVSIPNVRFLDVIGKLAEGRWEYGKFGILDETHLRFFTKKEMETLLRRAGFEPEGVSENLSPLYGSLPPGHSGDVSFGRVTFRDQTREEVKDLFVYQYLFKARKEDSEAVTRDRRVDAALASGDIDGARAVLDGYLEAHPLDAEALLRRSEICIRQGRGDEALEDLGKILLFDPRREDALARKAAIESARLPGG